VVGILVLIDQHHFVKYDNTLYSALERYSLTHSLESRHEQQDQGPVSHMLSTTT